jgi:putative FmdB family regulatory protein
MTYEYVCSACAHEWEAEQRISEAPLTECPACHAPKAKRQISAGAGFILKGSGWYSDGYSSAKSDAKPEAKSEPAKSEPAKSEPAKSDSKPEAKSESAKTETKKPSDSKAAAA